jgi:hypothetical protein
MGHPYYPIDANIVNYVENHDDILVVVLKFSLFLSIILGLVSILAYRARPSISQSDVFATLWYTLCERHIYYNNS